MHSITKLTTVLRILLVLAVGPCVMPAAAQGTSPQSAGWTPAEMMKVKDVGNVQVSPDGRRVVYTVTEAVMTDDKSEYLTQIHLASSDRTGGQQITFGDKSNSSPQWSPDGRTIAFASSRGGRRNVWLLPVDGGEAQQLTDAKTGVGLFKWSPTGQQIAFLMTDQPTTAQEKAKRGKDDATVVGEGFQLTRLWIIPIEPDSSGQRQARLLTKENFTLGHPTFGRHGFDWSPDARTIVFAHMPTPHYEDAFIAEVSTVDVATGTVRSVTPAKSVIRQTLYSPDGRWIAYLTDAASPHHTYFSILNLMVVPASGGQPRRLAETFDRFAFLGGGGIVGWSADSQSIYFTETAGTGTLLAALPLNGGPPRAVDKRAGMAYGFGINASGTTVGFTAQSSGSAPEAYVARLDSFAPVQVSRANTALPAHPHGRTEVIRWKSTDGMEIEGLLTYPVDFQSGRRCPLLLMIHGGPHGVFKQQFDADPGSVYPTAIFAARGYAVLRPNPRGSAGYGAAFRVASFRDLGGMDYQDLMSGVDHVIQLGVADAERLGVMGWSYGGYMTAWAITRSQRFKAASVGAGMSNLISDTGTTDLPSIIPADLGAEHWQDATLYHERSPISHVGAVSTPTLILHGESDIRVPISQGYELYTALKRRGVPVTMVTYPRMPHSPDEPKQLLDIATRNLEWFDRHLRSNQQAERR